MTISKNINNYIYTKPVLDKALEHGSVTFQCDTLKDAMKFRAHANFYKRLCGLNGPTEYDKLEIVLEKNTLVIKTKEIKGVLFVTGQQSSKITVEAAEPDDPLLDFARGLAENLPKEDDLEL